MKKFVSSVLMMTMIFGVFSPLAVSAQTDTKKVDDTKKTTTVQETTTKTEAQTDDSTDSTQRDKRIDLYKKQFSEKLTQAQQKKLGTACKSAQGKVTNYHNNLKSAVQKRSGHYETITGKLEELKTKLEAASIDTAELETVMTEIDAKVAAITQAATDYDTALSDLVAMDCATDPTGFKAALSVAREKRAAVLSEIQALKDYVNSTVKTLLKSLREQISNSSSGVEGQN